MSKTFTRNDLSIDEHNSEMLIQAREALTREVNAFLRMGWANGAVAIRIPINRGKLGNIRVIPERDHQPD